MFIINSMQVLYKQSALMESLMTHKTKIRLSVNGGQSFVSQEVPVSQKLAVWNQGQTFPPIKIQKPSNTVSLQFYFIKNNQQVGKTKCSILFGKNRKDCLDIANRSYQIVGKFLYTAYWKFNEPLRYPDRNQQMHNRRVYEQKKFQPNYAYYQQRDNKPIQRVKEINNYNNPLNYGQYPQLKSKNIQKSLSSDYKPPDLSKPYFTNTQMSEIKKEEVKTTSSNNSIFTAWLFSGGCFGKRKLKKSKAYFAIEPIVIQDNELPYAPPNEQQPFPIQYYTKRIVEKYSS